MDYTKKTGLKVYKRYKNQHNTYKNRSYIERDIATQFAFLTINLASPERIRGWAERLLPTGHIIGEVLIADTFNYRTFKPEMGGLFCERIFGPLGDWECQCKRYICVYSPGKVCERCCVELTESRVRRHRMGFIDLINPAAHLWFLKGLPSYLSLILECSISLLDSIVYYRINLPEYDIEEDGGISGSTYKDDEDEAATMELDELILRLDKDYELHKSLLTKNKEKELDLVEDDLESLLLFSKNGGLSLDSHIARVRRYLQKPKSGAFILKEILAGLDLQTEIAKVRYRILTYLPNNKIKCARSSKRLRILESFYITETDPSWMILTCIPVLPPDLRPMMELGGGQLVSSDLNELYRTVIHRNARLCEILQLNAAPDIIIRNEKRLLQQAVDALIDNEKIEEQAFSPHNDRPLRSLAETIEGKFGRFRQNLLGKRVDYSGRSVIVVGPTLRLNQCGLPFDIISELFQCQIADALITLKIVKSIQLARSLSRCPNNIMLRLVEYLLLNQPILLNRAPTLHRLGVQAFDPILVPGQAIHLHPLVCASFNADFDGDQMGVHIPLSTPAQIEAKYLMRSSYNILSPADSSPIFKPAQDMVIGCYYLTLDNDFFNHISRGHYFSSSNEVLSAFANKKLVLHGPIWLRFSFFEVDYQSIYALKDSFYICQTEKGKVFLNKQLQIFFDNEDKFVSAYIRTTAGRVIFNALVEDFFSSRFLSMLTPGGIKNL